MEKEEKIKKAEVTAEANIYEILRKIYPVYAVIQISVIRLLMFWYFYEEEGGFKPYGAPFIFIICSTDFGNEIVTGVVALVTQTWLNHYIIFDKSAPIGVASAQSHHLFDGQLDAVFNLVFCVALVAVFRTFFKSEDVP